MNPFLPPEHKFAILALSNVRADFPDELNLPGGVGVLRKFPIELDPNWRNWVGLDLPRLTDANLVLVCTDRDRLPLSNLSVADATNTALANRLVEVFVMLRLLGTIEYQSAFSVTGYTGRDKTFCQNYSKLDPLYFTRGCLPWLLRPVNLEAAARLAAAKQSFLSSFPDLPKVRIFRGWVALSSALQQHFASDRIHGFVRALEALIYPDVGKTARQFADRCSLFAAPSERRTAVWDVLREAYLMRCDVEHVHDWDRSLSKYDVAEREDVAYWRTRQMETLTCLAYARIFRDPELQRIFSRDEDIADLWQKPGGEIEALFRDPFDTTQLEIVTEYDLMGRARASQWPAGWIEGLQRMYP